MEAKRILLQPGDTVCLSRQPGGPAAETWVITGLEGEGGSSVCYTARSGMKSGRLKEFYPGDMEACFARTGDGQLYVFDRKQIPAFEELREGFCHAFHLLERAKQDSRQGALLNNFLPPYVLLWGVPPEKLPGTVYIWTPDDKQGILFSDYLEQVHGDPEGQPELSLYNILETVLTLTGCIRTLHGAGLLHLDIKPSNFLVLQDEEGNLRPQNISLFDINTLYSREEPLCCLGGTGGYCAPEVRQGWADHRSDLYSIGATLLRGLLPGEIYSREKYAMLDQLTASSPLIRCSETNSNVFLRHALSRILKKTLAWHSSDRYPGCEELMADLKKAKTFLLPQIMGSHLGPGKRLTVLDAEPRLPRSSRAVIQDLFFRHPAEAALEPEEEQLQVLLLGAGTYGQTFLDVCLQTCLLPDKQLRITAASRDPDLDREVYLQIRPALPAFVDCGNRPPLRDPYARLRFVGVGGELGEEEAENRRILAGVLRRLPGRVHCIFVALGQDERNRAVAELAAELTDHPCKVHYVVHGEQTGASGRALPVQIDRPLTMGGIDPQLERMAFNTHLTWMDDPNADMELAWVQFREKYNYESSMAYALSIQSKLHSASVWEKDWRKAARQFREALEDESFLQKLAALEHRRWVMEKITSGYQAADCTDEAVREAFCRGALADKEKKTHPCIVPSSPSMPLAGFSPEQWNVPCPEEQGLDPLDRVSLQLHRGAAVLAEERRKVLPLQQEDLTALGHLAEGTRAQAECYRYRSCLEQILNGDAAASRQLPARERALLDCFPPQHRKEAEARLRHIAVRYFPVIHSNLYRDYKAYDVQLIRQIPRILTRDPKCHLAVVCGSSEEMLSYTASAMILRPEVVTCVLCGDEPQAEVLGLGTLLDTLGKFCHQVRILAVVSPSEDGEQALYRVLSRYQEERQLHSFRILRSEREQMLPILAGSLKEDGCLLDTASAAETGAEELTRALARLVPSFRFDREEERFRECRDCEYLEYWNGDIRVSLDWTQTDDYVLPWDSDTCRSLWETAGDYWQALCENLICRTDDLGTLRRRKRGAPEEMTVFLGSRRQDQVEQLLTLLLTHGLAEPGSRLEWGETEGLTLRLRTGASPGKMEKFLEKLDTLEDWQTLRAKPEPDGSVRFLRDWPTAQLTEKDPKWLPVLRQLQRLGVITGLRTNRGKTVFRWASPRAKWLLWDHRHLEQLLLARRLEDTGSFDRVRLLPDLGCLVIRGFRMGAVYREEGTLRLQRLEPDRMGDLRAMDMLPVSLPEISPETAVAELLSARKKENENVHTEADGYTGCVPAPGTGGADGAAGPKCP